MTKAVFVETYEIRNFRSNFRPMLVYLYRVYFLTTLDIYKDYFKSHHKVMHDFVTKYFLILIADEVKNFVANNLLQVTGVSHILGFVH